MNTGSGGGSDVGTGVGNGVGVIIGVRMGEGETAGVYADESVGLEAGKSPEHAVKSIAETAIKNAGTIPLSAFIICVPPRACFIV